MGRRFYKLDQDLARRRDLKPTDKLLFAIIANYIGKNPHTWVGVRTLGKDAGINKDTARESVERLANVGVIEVDDHGRGKRRYIRLAPDWAKCPETPNSCDSQSVRKRRTVESIECPEHPDTSVRETQTQVSGKPGPNKKRLTKRRTTAPEQEESVMLFPVKGSTSEWALTKAKVAEWAEAFAGLDVEAECRQALQWCRDNPANQKTAKGMTRFLGGWLRRAVAERQGQTAADEQASIDAQAEEHVRKVKERQAKMNGIGQETPHEKTDIPT